MLSVPTLWVVFVINFLALGLVWTHVVHSYPSFTPARYWRAASLVVCCGAILGLLRGVIDVRVSLIFGGSTVIFACCLTWMGIVKFYGRRPSWWLAAATTCWSLVGLSFFLMVVDSMAMRIVVYSFCQSVPVAMTLPLLLSRKQPRNPGARMAGTVAILILAVHAIRSVAALLGFGGELSMVNFNDFQAGMVLLLVFLSMAINFGFLLMSIDRLRAEAASLALLDDLTGVANRRHLLQRISELCDDAMRSGEPFAVLAIDLDGFKAINDGYGHAAGDECLRRFSRAAQSRLRAGDLLARTGGDEFCVVMPDTTLREGAMIARHILEESRAIAVRAGAIDISFAASIGIAQWTRSMGTDPSRLVAAADLALYSAKKLGKDRYAVYEPTPESPTPDHAALRKIA